MGSGPDKFKDFSQFHRGKSTITKVILEDGITIGKGKTLKEHLEVINHKEAIDYIEDIVNRNIDINQNVIKDLHYIILKSINNENAGRYRSVNVLISGSNHRPPEHFLVPQEMGERGIYERSWKSKYWK